MNIDIYLQNLALPSWFRRIGQKQAHSQYLIQPVTILSTMEDAVTTWEQNLDYRCDLWEELRVKLLDNLVWDKDFHSVRDETWRIMQKNENFTALANELYHRTGLEPEFFCSQLPILGYWGEMLLGINNGSYAQQTDLFKLGCFVCGKSDNWIVY